MRALCILAAAAALLLAAGAPAAAQQPDAVSRLTVSDTIYEIRLRDGSTLFGRVVAAEGDSVSLLTRAGARVTVGRAQIRSVAPVRGSVRNGEVWPEDPNRTRLFFGPTARTLRAGEGYVGAYELFLPFVAIGVSDRFTLAGGTPIVPGAIGRVWYLAPKVELVRRERFQLSSGVLAFADFDSDDDPIGVVYGAGSWGGADNSVPGGAGWAFAGSDIEHRPVLMAGGETRVSGRVKLVTENYLYFGRERSDPYYAPEPTYETEFVGLLGGGVRIFGERLSGDLGIGAGVGSQDFGCCIPLVNFVYNFGRRR